MTITLEEIAADVSGIVTAVSPFVAAAFPAEAASLTVAFQIVQGVIAAEPYAVKLYNQITGGTAVSPQQLAEYIAANRAANVQTDADISAALEKFAAATKP